MFYLCIITLFLTFLLFFIWKPQKNFNVFITQVGVVFALLLPILMIFPLDLIDDVNIKDVFFIPAILSALSVPLIIIGLILSIRKRESIRNYSFMMKLYAMVFIVEFLAYRAVFQGEFLNF